MLVSSRISKWRFLFMQQTIPVVKKGRLYQSERESVPIDVGTPSWYAWLEKHSLFIFVDHVCAVSVHNAYTGQGEPEWKASRKRMAKAFTISLGSSNAINISNLRAAARRLAGKQAYIRTTIESMGRPASSIVPVAKPVTTTGPLQTLMRT